MISKTAKHGLKALAYLAQRPGEFQGAASIAERIGAPQNYLGKLLQLLATSGLVYSQKGKGGGFQLARKSEDISLLDIIDPIDSVSKWEGCFMGTGACSTKPPCAMHHQWAAVREAYLEMLNTNTLANVIEGAIQVE